MVADHACGIDIQHIGPQILKVKDRIASSTEQTLAQQIFPMDTEIALTMVWAVKEALKKHRLPEDPGIFEAINIGRISPETGTNSWLAECCIAGNNQIHIVHVAHLNQYILAWSHG
jgi:phosphopantetheinyl transferase